MTIRVHGVEKLVGGVQCGHKYLAILLLVLVVVYWWWRQGDYWWFQVDWMSTVWKSWMEVERWMLGAGK